MSEVGKSNYWRTLVVLLCLGWVMIWIYRSILTPIYPQVMATLDLHSNQEISLIYSAYFFTYVLFQVPAGIISDRLDKRYVLGGGFLIFAVAIFFMSRTQGASLFYLASAIAGIAGAFYYGAAFALSNNEIPKQKRNIANAIINSGTAIGIVIGLNGASYVVIVNGFNWQNMLAIVAVIVFITAIIFLIKIRDHNQVSKQTNVSTAQLSEQKASGNYFTLMKVAIYFALFCSAYAYFMVISWLPNFLQNERGFVGGGAGLISSMVAIASLPGALFFAAIADRFNHRRFIIMVFLLLIAALTLFLAVFVSNITVIVICLVAYGFFGKLALDPLLISSLSEISNKYKLATSLSIYNCFGMSASFIAPFLAGRIADQTATIASAFYLACIILVLGAVGFTVAVFMTKIRSSNV